MRGCGSGYRCSTRRDWSPPDPNEGFQVIPSSFPRLSLAHTKGYLKFFGKSVPSAAQILSAIQKSTVGRASLSAIPPPRQWRAGTPAPLACEAQPLGESVRG